MRTRLFFISQFLLTGIAPAGSGGLFTENKGQWPEQVFFRTSFSQHAVFVEQNAFTVVVWSGASMGHAHSSAPATPGGQRHAYRVRFLGADGSRPMGSEQMTGVENFFLGHEPAHWGTNARRYQELGSTDLYPGIDLRLNAEGSFKYELLVRPDASPDIIALRYEGQDGLSLKNGELLIQTSVGTMIEKAPVAYQERDGSRVAVACEYVLQGDRLRYSFPEGYDRSLALVIDPSLVFSTFSGSLSDNFGSSATYDHSGHLYSGSIAFGNAYPTALGSYQSAFAGGDVDIALSKFELDGSAMLWSTYIGGAGSECPLGLVVNAGEELFLLAVTGSADFPIGPDAFDNTFHGGAPPDLLGSGFTFDNGGDLALVRLSHGGDALLGGTFLGGDGTDGVNDTVPLAHNYNDRLRGGIILDDAGDPVIAVPTLSTDLPTSPDAPQPALAGGQDGYVARLSATLDEVIWATYIGGTGDDAAYALCTNSLGEIIVTGGTTSSDLPMAGAPFNGTFGGVADAFVARYSASGDQLLASTYLGTSAYDQGYFVDVDAQDDVVVLGQSEGGYPVTPGLYTNPNSASFLQKLTADLGAGIWSTVIGNGTGHTDISPVAFGIDGTDRILLCGFGGVIGFPGEPPFSTTDGLPVTADAFQLTTDGKDMYIAVLTPNATGLQYASFLGGDLSHEHIDGGSSSFDENGDLYLAVCAGCGWHSDFPTTPGAFSATNNSANCNLAVVKFTTDGTTAIPGQARNDDAFVWPTIADALLHVSGCDAPPCPVTITDATGRSVSRTFLKSPTGELAVDQLAPGVYQVRMGDRVGAKYARFIVP
ncbi:MAG: T9SS type A sorting domain-containing protein [Flavobacteriales bacterium]